MSDALKLVAGLIADLSAEKRARLVEMLRPTPEPIAIVGMGCRFPGGSNNPDAYWQLLRDGGDAITEVPAHRWDVDAYFDLDPEAPGKINTRYGGFLDQVDQFDAAFFGISPREAHRMDPQQRLLLEVAWEALEYAGLLPEKLAGSKTGVFMGIMTSEYLQFQFADPANIDAYVSTGTADSILPNRLSYVLDLHGPSVAVDSACSSSLVALHLACRSLRARECDLALAGGVQLILSPLWTISSTKFGIMAPDGRCKTFDASANGFVRSEGCGTVVLKRLSDAQRDGDRILALIRGSAVNQDGRSAGLTAPNVLAQQALLRQALQDAQVSPDQITYVEAHGTGTPLGDPIEMEALSTVYGSAREPDNVCMLGAVKSNMGHLEAAAGVAGLIKTVLALYNEAIPPNLHFKKLNPRIYLEDKPLAVSTRLTTWPASGKQRFAGVSSFGIGGTNAHVILEEAPRPAAAPTAAPAPATAAPLLLPLSARTPAALTALARSFAAFLSDTRAHPAAIAATAALRRSHHPYRLAVVGNRRDAWQAGLQAFLTGQSHPGVVTGMADPAQSPRLAFVFPGQGSQWLGMGRTLRTQYPVFQHALDACDEAFRPFVDWSLHAQLDGDPATSRLDDIGVIQPTLFAMQVALAALWRAWGIQPDAVIGHSMGEVAAAHVAGALSLDDAARIICRRSDLLRRVRGQGAMAVVELTMDDAAAAMQGYEDRLSIAVSNSRRSTVLAGDPAALDTVREHLTAQGVFCRPVHVDVASHSPQMDPLCAPLLEALAAVTPQAGQVPIYSAVTGDISDGAGYDAAYWVRNLREPVRFGAMVARLIADGYTLFVEVSAHPLLVPAIEEGLHDAGAPGRVLPSLRRDEDEPAVLLESLGALYTAGVPLDWRGQHPTPQPVVTLPTYPWQRERFWLDVPPTARQAAGRHPLLGVRVDVAGAQARHVWELDLTSECLPYLADHQVQGQVVLPGSAYVEMALAAAADIAGTTAHQVRDLRLAQMLALGDEPHTVQVVLERQAQDTAYVTIWSRPADRTDAHWLRHAVATVVLAYPAQERETSDPIAAIQSRCPQPMTAAEHYTGLAERGLRYGPAFHGVAHIWRGAGEVLGQVRLPDSLVKDAPRYRLHPALLDACLQVASAALPQDNPDTYLPVFIEQVAGLTTLPTELWCFVQRRDPHDPQAEQIVFDLRLQSATGDPLLHINGLTVQRLAPAAHDDLADWLYTLDWHDVALPADPPAWSGPGTWLILTDQGGLGAALADRLQAQGQHCVLVVPGDQYQQIEPDRYIVPPLERESWTHLLRDSAEQHGSPWRGVLHLWSLDQKTPDTSGGTLADGQAHGCGSTLHLVQALAQSGWRDLPRLWLLTRGAQAVMVDEQLTAVQAPLWGLGRVIAYEYPELRCSQVDIGSESVEQSAEALLCELAADSPENQIALRGTTRRVLRLVRYVPTDTARVTPEVLRPAGKRSFRLEQRQPGVLDGLTLCEVARQRPGPGEVEIEVVAASVNFLDILKAMGTYPGQEHGAAVLGSECAGRIAALGEGVEHLTVGQEVVAIASGSFARYVITRALFVAPKPAHLSFEEAATIPVVFTTVYYALHHLGHLGADERVLIHSATGGTGLAAIQMAQRVGAEIFATAGSDEKRALLTDMGIPHVMDSRSLVFADEVMRTTNGEGIDVVLNSLTGEAIGKGLAILRPYGRFLEIGKKDIYQDRLFGLSPFRKSLSYSAIDLAGMSLERPDLLAQLFCEVLALFEQQELRPLPMQVFPITQVVEAFHAIAQARHIGKLVLSLSNASEALIAPAIGSDNPFADDATYLLTGGLGGIGLTTARWMVERGARHLVLVGRSTPSAAAQATLSELEEAGASVTVLQADVGHAEQVSKMMRTIRETLPPLRGVLHVAGVIDDSTLLRLDWERFRKVLLSKIDGAWHLHTQTQDQPLDFFVLFSSVASLLGSPGQGNYAAANAFMDTLAYQRQAASQPALSINWGAWAEVGLAAAEASRGERLATRGMASIAPEQGMNILGRLLAYGSAQVAVMPFNLRQWREFYPKAATSPLFTRLAEEQRSSAAAQKSHLRETLLSAEPQERCDLLETHLREQLAQVLRLDLSRIEVDTPLGNLGLDSLMALEFRNRLEASLSLSLPATLVWGYPTLAALATHLADKMDITLEETAEAEVSVQPAENGGTEKGAELEDLSEDEMAAFLADKLAAIEGRG